MFDLLVFFSYVLSCSEDIDFDLFLCDTEYVSDVFIAFSLYISEVYACSLFLGQCVNKLFYLCYAVVTVCVLKWCCMVVTVWLLYVFVFSVLSYLSFSKCVECDVSADGDTPCFD